MPCSLQMPWGAFAASQKLRSKQLIGTSLRQDRSNEEEGGQTAICKFREQRVMGFRSVNCVV